MGFVEIIRADGTGELYGEPTLRDLLTDREWCDKCRSWQLKDFGRDFDDKLWFCQECK